MTTIAWDGTFLAADSQTTSNWTIVSDSSTKIHNFNNVYFAGSGKVSEIRQVARWLEGGAEGTLDALKTEKSEFLVVIDQRAYVLNENGLIPTHDKYYATGSGRDHAYGVLAGGGSAEKAVRSSICHDIGSGGEINIMETKPHRHVRFSPSSEIMPTLSDLKSYFKSWKDHYVKLGLKAEDSGIE